MNRPRAHGTFRGGSQHTQVRATARTCTACSLACSAWLLVGCSLYDPQPLTQRSTQTSQGSQRDIGGAPSAVAPAVSSLAAQPRAGSIAAAGEVEFGGALVDAAAPPAATGRSADAGATDEADEEDASAPSGPDETTDNEVFTTPRCPRATLLERAESYLTAMASSDATQLERHANVRFTENGEEQLLGLGVWLDSPQTEFARHVVDDTSCSTATEAVLNARSGKIVFGSRLRYVNDQLLEIETQVVRGTDVARYFDPEQIIPDGSDPWVEPLVGEDRRSQQHLVATAMRYFDSAADASLLPPHIVGCERRQNGAPLDRGTCDMPPGVERFDQTRFTVVDETTGVVTVLVAYRGSIGMYLIKQRADALQSIEAVGGARRDTTGW